MILSNKVTGWAIAAGVWLGLVLASGAVGTWWALEARYELVRLDQAAGGIDQAISDAAAIQLHSGERPVVVIGPRDNAEFEKWLTQDAALLAAKGRGVQTVIVPSQNGGAATDTTVAQLWLKPELSLLKQWLERPAQLWTAAGLVSVSRDGQRQEALAMAYGFADEIQAMTGAKGRWPLILWRDPSGAMVMCICDTAKSQAKARTTLGIAGQSPVIETHAPDAVAAATSAVEAVSDHAYPVGIAAEPAVIDLRQGALNEASGETSEGELPQETAIERTRLPGDPDRGEPLGPPVAIKPETPRPVRQRAAPRSVNTATPAPQKDAEALFY